MFEVGDKITFVDESIDGIVTNVIGAEIIVKTQDGFEVKCSSSEIIKRGYFDNEMSSYIEDDTLKKIIEEKIIGEKKSSNTKKVIKKEDYLIEVDLHIERILNRYKHMSSSEILDYQLHTAKYKLEQSIKGRKRGIIFIHGKGEGILRGELIYLFSNYNVEFCEADFSKYGGGATEVIFLNK